MRIVNVYVQQPRLFVRLSDELDGAFAGPRCLVQLGGHAILAGTQRVEVATLRSHPLGVIVPFSPVIARRMAEFPVAKPVINPRFRPLAGALQMKFSYQPAFIPGIGNEPRDHRRPIGESVVAVARVVHAAGIQTGHEARSTRRANGALAKRMRERDPLAHQPVHDRRAHVRVTQRTNRVKPLLVGAVPKNVRAGVHGRKSLRFRF